MTMEHFLLAMHIEFHAHSDRNQDFVDGLRFHMLAQVGKGWQEQTNVHNQLTQTAIKYNHYNTVIIFHQHT